MLKMNTWYTCNRGKYCYAIITAHIFADCRRYVLVRPRDKLVTQGVSPTVWEIIETTESIGYARARLKHFLEDYPCIVAIN